MYVRETDQPYVLDKAGFPVTPRLVRVVETQTAMRGGQLVPAVPVRAVDAPAVLNPATGHWADTVPVKVVDTERAQDAQGRWQDVMPVRVVSGVLGFNLDAFMAAQTGGFWLDFTKSDALFQETVGPTPADGSGEAIGLTLDQRMWLGQTRDQYLAGQAENRQNGAPVLAGSATAATYNTSTGAGTVTRVDFSNQSGVAISGLIGGRVYAIDIEAFVIGMAIRDNAVTGTGLAFFSGRSTIYVSPGPASSALVIAASTAGGTQGFTLHSLKEVAPHAGRQETASLKPKVVLVPKALGPERLSNTTFDTVAGASRTLGNATISATAGRLRLTSVDTSPSRWSMPVACEVGKIYRLVGSRFAAGRPSANLAVSATNVLAGAVAFTPVASADSTETLYFTATAATMFVGGEQAGPAGAGLVTEWDNFSVREVISYDLAADFDGLDDNLLTAYQAPHNTDLFIVVKAAFPASFVSTRIFIGAEQPGGALWLGIDANNGRLRYRHGDVAETVFAGGDLRGRTAVVGLSISGNIITFFEDDQIIGTVAKSGSAASGLPLRVGARNAVGVAANWFGGPAMHFMMGHQAIDLATFVNIGKRF